MHLQLPVVFSAAASGVAAGKMSRTFSPSAPRRWTSASPRISDDGHDDGSTAFDIALARSAQSVVSLTITQELTTEYEPSEASEDLVQEDDEPSGMVVAFKVLRTAFHKRTC